MGTKWIKAAEAYETEGKKVNGNAPLVIRAVARDLDQFLRSAHGKDALRLLAASQKIVVFGEKSLDRGFIEAYFLDAEGLRMASLNDNSHVYHAPATHGARRYSRATVQHCDPIDAVTAFARHDPFKVGGLMGWLNAQLDVIAEQAPKIT